MSDTLKQIIIAALKDNTTEMEGYTYFGSNPGVPKDSYEEVADEIVAKFGASNAAAPVADAAFDPALQGKEGQRNVS